MRTGYIAGLVVAVVVFASTFVLQEQPDAKVSTTSTVTVSLKNTGAQQDSPDSPDYLTIAAGTVRSWIADPATVKDSVEAAAFPSLAADQSEYFTVIATPLSASFAVQRVGSNAAQNEKELANLVAVLQERAAEQKGDNPAILITSSTPVSGDVAAPLPLNVVASAGIGVLLGVLVAALTERAASKKTV